MDILDIAIAKQLAGGGGGSGTDNYNDLSNLPKINDVTLSGNKSSSALGLQSEITSENKLDSDLIDDTDQDNKFVTSSEKNIWNAKQNAIDADHKLNADYVDDSTSTNKFVTASDKEAWNAKQNAIDNSHKLSSDLVDDANHTNKFVTSTEKNTWNGKQNAIDSDHKLSSSLVSFTIAETAALASGIDSAKVAQISTNQSNILYNLNMGVKNELDNLGTTSYESSGVTFTFNKDGSVRIKGTATGANAVFYYYTGAYSYIPNIYKGHILSGVTGGAEGTYGLLTQYSSNGTSWATQEMCKTAPITIKSDYNYINICIIVFSGQTVDATIYPMLCDPTVWAQSHDFMPPALPNYDLTRLEAEDRAALAEEIDTGAKQLAQGQNNSGSAGAATIQSDGYTVKLTGSAASSSSLSFAATGTIQKTGTYVFAIEASGTMDRISIWDNTASASVETLYATGSKEVTLTAGHSYALFHFAGSAMTLNATVKYMICTKAAFGVSKAFVPFGTDPFYQVPINHNMIYRGRNLGATLTDAQHTALSSGNFTDLYLGDYWTKTVTIPAGTYTGGDGEEVTVPAQTNITLKAVIADFDTFYAGYASSFAGINTHHAAVIVTGFSNVVWNKTNSTAGGYVASLIHKWLVGSALPQIETWFGSAKVLSHQKLLTNAITGDAASGWAWSSQKISLLSENQMYGSNVWGNSKAANGGYEPGEAFKHLNVFNHIDANLLFGNKNIWLRDIASAVGAAGLNYGGSANRSDASNTGIAPAALILLS